MTRATAVAVIFVASLAALAASQPSDFLGASCVGSTCDNGLQCLSLTGDACSQTAWSLDGSSVCTCGGVGGETDPYFTGFWGSSQGFYFPANPDTVYNVFSEREHLVNALFVATEMPEESDLLSKLTGAKNSSFIGAVAVRHGNASVEVSADKEGDLTVIVNGTPLSLGDLYTDFELTVALGDDLLLTVQKYQPPLLSEIRVESDLLFVGITPERVHKDNLGNVVRGHLSMQMNLKQPWESVPYAHGILGQTVDPSIESEEDVFPGEGQPSDYIVSSLWSHDFEYDVFEEGRSTAKQQQQQQQPPATVAASRRMLSSRRTSQQPLKAAVRSPLSLHH